MEKAKALMKQAGYEKGVTFECIGTSNESWGIPVVEAIMPFLRAINITVKPQQVEGAALAPLLQKLDYQAYIWSLSSGAGGDSLSGPGPMGVEESAHCRKLRDVQQPRVRQAPGRSAEGAGRRQAERDPAQSRCHLQGRRADLVLQLQQAVIAHQPWVKGIKPVAIELMYQDLTDLWIDESSPRANQK